MTETGKVSRGRRMVIIAVEVILVFLVLILLLATYLPAIIGGNPER